MRKLKLIVATAVTGFALSVATPAFAGDTGGSGGTGGTDCSNANLGSISVLQGTAQCTNVTVNPVVVVDPSVALLTWKK